MNIGYIPLLSHTQAHTHEQTNCATYPSVRDCVQRVIYGQTMQCTTIFFAQRYRMARQAKAGKPIGAIKHAAFTFTRITSRQNNEAANFLYLSLVTEHDRFRKRFPMNLLLLINIHARSPHITHAANKRTNIPIEP